MLTSTFKASMAYSTSSGSRVPRLAWIINFLASWTMRWSRYSTSAASVSADPEPKVSIGRDIATSYSITKHKTNRHGEERGSHRDTIGRVDSHNFGRRHLDWSVQGRSQTLTDRCWQSHIHLTLHHSTWMSQSLQAAGQDILCPIYFRCLRLQPRPFVITCPHKHNKSWCHGMVLEPKYESFHKW